MTDFGAPFNAKAWNEVANAVGCGTSKLTNVCQPHANSILDANTDQFNCMKGTSASTLKSAVMNSTDFVAVQDGKI